MTISLTRPARNLATREEIKSGAVIPADPLLWPARRLREQYNLSPGIARLVAAPVFGGDDECHLS